MRWKDKWEKPCAFDPRHDTVVRGRQVRLCDLHYFQLLRAGLLDESREGD